MSWLYLTLTAYFWRWSGIVLPLLLVFPLPLCPPCGLFCSSDGAFPSVPLFPRGSRHSRLFLCPVPCSRSRHPVASWVWLLGCGGHISLSLAQATRKPFLACHLSCSCVPVLRDAITRCKQGKFPGERPAALIPFFRQVLNPSHSLLILPSIPSPVRPSPSVTSPTQPFLLHCTSCLTFPSFLSCLESLWASAASPVLLLQEAAPLWALKEVPGPPWAPSSCCPHLP